MLYFEATFIPMYDEVACYIQILIFCSHIEDISSQGTAVNGYERRDCVFNLLSSSIFLDSIQSYWPAFMACVGAHSSLTARFLWVCVG
jgi:hypothetical protein